MAPLLWSEMGGGRGKRGTAEAGHGGAVGSGQSIAVPHVTTGGGR